MFIQSYEKLRYLLCNKKTIETLIQFEYSAFAEATVPVCTFAFKNSYINKKGCYFRLTDFRGGMEVQRQKTLEAIANHDCGFYYEQSADNFSKIPGSPIAYWWRNFSIFDFKTIGDYYESAGRNKTHNNELYVRNWWEISNRTRWQPYANGGVFRRWAGNDCDLVDWSETAKESYALHGGLYNQKYNGKRGICWNLITSYKNGFKIKHEKHHYSSGAPTIIASGVNYDYYVLAYLNCIVSSSLLNIFNPTLNTTVNDVLDLPLKIEKEEKVECTSQQSTELSHNDWDSFETSWDFTVHPLVRCKSFSPEEVAEDAKHNIVDMNYVKEAVTRWSNECYLRFQKLKENEEELNRIFIDIYGLQDELTPEVEDKDITVHRVFENRDEVPDSMKNSNYTRTYRDEIVSLLSYAVGCMFGRYSIYKDGLLFAGEPYSLQTFADKLNDRPGTISADELERAYRNEGVVVDEMFFPDADNVIPITDEEYLDDDIVSRLCTWLKAVYGADTLEANLDYIAKALGNKGSTSREIIRSYFLKDFFKDHCKIYQKRPIYWLFDSGKQNGFKALIYLHRYTPDTIGNLRVDYLHKMQRVYESEIGRMQDMIDHSTNSREVAVSTKRKEKLQKQLKECRDYDEMIAHLALNRIELDLDDGVKVNYRKIQTAADGKFYEVLADSKSIMAKEK